MKILVTLFAAFFAVSVLAADQRIVDTYKRACTICHANGVAGAPKAGDKGKWQELLDAKGMDALVDSVRNGLNAMPPRGMCFDCSDDDYKALIQYMMEPQA